MTQSNTSANLAVVDAYFDAMDRHDADALASLLADDVVMVFPLSISGEQKPESLFKNKQETMAYLHAALANFSQARLKDVVTHEANDGRTVFLEAKGDLIRAETSERYLNVYCYRFVIEGGKIAHVTEYANPVTYAKIMGLPIG